MGAAAPFLAIAGPILSAGMQIVSGFQQAGALRAQGAQTRANNIQRMAAGVETGNRIRREANEAMGAANARFAAAGIALGQSGAPEQVADQILFDSERQLRINRGQTDFEVATGENQRRQQISAARFTRISAIVGGAGTLASGANAFAKIGNVPGTGPSFGSGFGNERLPGRT